MASQVPNLGHGLSLEELHRIEQEVSTAVQSITDIVEKATNASLSQPSYTKDMQKLLAELKPLVQNLQKLKKQQLQYNLQLQGALTTLDRHEKFDASFMTKIDNMNSHVEKLNDKFKNLTADPAKEIAKEVNALLTAQQPDDTLRSILTRDITAIIKAQLTEPDNIKKIIEKFYENKSFQSLSEKWGEIFSSLGGDAKGQLAKLDGIAGAVEKLGKADDVVNALQTLENKIPETNKKELGELVTQCKAINEKVLSVPSWTKLRNFLQANQEMLMKALGPQGSLAKQVNQALKGIQKVQKNTSSERMGNVISGLEVMQQVKTFYEEAKDIRVFTNICELVNEFGILQGGGGTQTAAQKFTELYNSIQPAPDDTDEAVAKISSWMDVFNRIEDINDGNNIMTFMLELLNTFNDMNDAVSKVDKVLNPDGKGDNTNTAVDIAGIQKVLNSHLNNSATKGEQITKAVTETIEQTLGSESTSWYASGLIRSLPKASRGASAANIAGKSEMTSHRVVDFWNNDTTRQTVIWGSKSEVGILSQTIRAGYVRQPLEGLGDDYDRSVAALGVATAPYFRHYNSSVNGLSYAGQRNTDQYIRDLEQVERGWRDHAAQLGAPTGSENPVVTAVANMRVKAYAQGELTAASIIALLSETSVHALWRDNPSPTGPSAPTPPTSTSLPYVFFCVPSPQYGGIRVLSSGPGRCSADRTVIIMCSENGHSETDDLRPWMFWDLGSKWSVMCPPANMRSSNNVVDKVAGAMKTRIANSRARIEMLEPYEEDERVIEDQIALLSGFRASSSMGASRSHSRMNMLSRLEMINKEGDISADLTAAAEAVRRKNTPRAPHGAKKALNMTNELARHSLTSLKSSLASIRTAEGESSTSRKRSRDQAMPPPQVMSAGSQIPSPSENLISRYGKGEYYYVGSPKDTLPDNMFYGNMRDLLKEADLVAEMARLNNDGPKECVATTLSRYTGEKREPRNKEWTNIDEACDECVEMGGRDCFVVIPHQLVIHKGFARPKTAGNEDRRAPGMTDPAADNNQGAQFGVSGDAGVGGSQNIREQTTSTTANDNQPGPQLPAQQTAGQAGTQAGGQPGNPPSAQAPTQQASPAAAFPTTTKNPQGYPPAPAATTYHLVRGTAAGTYKLVPDYFGPGELIHIGGTGGSIINSHMFTQDGKYFLEKADKVRVKTVPLGFRDKNVKYNRESNDLLQCMAETTGNKKKGDSKWTGAMGACQNCAAKDRECLVMLDVETVFRKANGPT